MTNPLISAYSVFHSYPLNWLQQALNGYATQTYTNKEYIFLIYGKDNDLDGILNTLSNVDIKYKLYFKPEIDNFIDAIHFAVSKCNGKYICRADAEDILLPNALSIMKDKIYSVMMVIPNYLSIDNDGSIIDSNVDGKIEHISSNCLISREHFNEVKFHKFQTCRDGLAIRNYFKDRYAIRYLDIPLFKYRINTNGLPNNVRTTLIKEWNERIINDMYDWNLDDNEIIIDSTDTSITTNKRKMEI